MEGIRTRLRLLAGGRSVKQAQRSEKAWRTSHDPVLNEVVCRLESFPSSVRIPVHHALESAGLVIELLIYPRSGRALAGVDPAAVEREVYRRLYGLLIRRQISLLHADLLGQVQPTRQLERAVDQIFGETPAIATRTDLISQLEEILQTRFSRTQGNRVLRVVEHAYASMLTTLRGGHLSSAV